MGKRGSSRRSGGSGGGGRGPKRSGEGVKSGRRGLEFGIQTGLSITLRIKMTPYDAVLTITLNCDNVTSIMTVLAIIPLI